MARRCLHLPGGIAHYGHSLSLQSHCLAGICTSPPHRCPRRCIPHLAHQLSIDVADGLTWSFSPHTTQICCHFVFIQLLITLHQSFILTFLILYTSHIIQILLKGLHDA